MNLTWKMIRRKRRKWRIRLRLNLRSGSCQYLITGSRILAQFVDNELPVRLHLLARLFQRRENRFRCSRIVAVAREIGDQFFLVADAFLPSTMCRPDACAAFTYADDVSALGHRKWLRVAAMVDQVLPRRGSTLELPLNFTGDEKKDEAAN